jgi:hypothetical protein
MPFGFHLAVDTHQLTAIAEFLARSTDLVYHHSALLRAQTLSATVGRYRRTEPATMTPSLRKLVLTAHITFSVGWIGAVAAFLALAIAGLTSHDVQMVRAASLAMELTARFVIVRWP